jgi:ABC-type amino acid transport substrate-binding protein
MRLGLALTIGALILCVATARAVGSEEVRVVTFCYNDWPPYAALADGEAVGLSVDVLREAARRGGWRAHFVELPWKRCLQAVRDGEVDAVMDASDRPEFVHGAVSFSVYTNTFWVREDDPLLVFAPAALAGRRLGLVTGYIYGDAMDALFNEYGMQIDRSVDDAMNIKKLSFGRTDVIVGDFVSTQRFVNAKQLNLRVLQPSHSVDFLHTSFNPASAAIMQGVDAALLEMCRDGWIEAAYRKTLGVGFSVVTGAADCTPASLAAVRN